MLVQGMAPNFLTRGKGAYIWDVDGNRYIDYINSLGPTILVHAYEPVNEAVYEQMKLGVSLAFRTPLKWKSPASLWSLFSLFLRAVDTCRPCKRFAVSMEPC
jgi:glutamate-1-semialdehyde aminotransferase